MDSKDFRSVLEAQREYFRSGATLGYEARRRALLALSDGLRANEEALLEALRLDLHKSRFEAYSNELATLNSEIAHSLAHLRSWMRPRRVLPELHLLPSRGEIRPQSLGCALIIAPWNYPIQLALAPLVAALAAGCTAIIKPSEISLNSEKILATMIGKIFDPRLVAVVTGGPEVSTEILGLPFDKYFFTGSPAVGTIVMKAAAERLASVTLELGGKSPALVDSTVDLLASARMIAWGKFINAGQTCVAPDYVLVEKSVKAPFLEALRAVIVEFFGEEPKLSPNFGRIINRRHFDRISSYLSQGQIVAGGERDPEALYIAPTLLDCDDWEAPVMTDEIFGPLLPVLGYSSPEEAACRAAAEAPCPVHLLERQADEGPVEGFHSLRGRRHPFDRPPIRLESPALRRDRGERLGELPREGGFRRLHPVQEHPDSKPTPRAGFVLPAQDDALGIGTIYNRGRAYASEALSLAPEPRGLRPQRPSPGPHGLSAGAFQSISPSLKR